MRCRAAGAVVTSLIGMAGAQAQPQYVVPVQIASVQLGDLSLEQLREVVVWTVGRQREHLGTAAAAVYVISADDIRRSGATTRADANLLLQAEDQRRHDRPRADRTPVHRLAPADAVAAGPRRPAQLDLPGLYRANDAAPPTHTPRASARQWPQVAFLDIGMPGLNGLDLARQIRASRSQRDRLHRRRS